MNKQPEITHATREAFIEAFVILYKQKPMEKITVKELAALAGYNRTTFYHYFDDIYALYDYMAETAFTEIKKK